MPQTDGAANSLAQTVGSPSVIYPYLLVQHAQFEQEARQGIGDRVFETEFRRGLQARFEDVAAYAPDGREEATSLPDQDARVSRGGSSR
ncbi:hypothetical protein RhoFasB10_05071 [Rhodococcus sp. B10]|nr:hypothetical protein [Rhodococcus sp. B10]